MLVPFHRFALRRFAVAMAIAVFPLSAFAWGSQAGDNGRQPIGADTDSPRQAIPNATSNDAPIDYQAGTAYYGATTAHQRALYYCDQKPVELRDTCRDAADARYGFPNDTYVASYPSYMTYYEQSGPVYYTYPSAQVWHYDTYSATPEYYVYSPYPSSTWMGNTRCAPVYGAGPESCLHGSLPGG